MKAKLGEAEIEVIPTKTFGAVRKNHHEKDELCVFLDVTVGDALSFSVACRYDDLTNDFEVLSHNVYMHCRQGFKRVLVGVAKEVFVERVKAIRAEPR